MQKNLFNRNFSLVVIGQIVSILGAAVLRFALNLYVLDQTGRADLFAVFLAASTIPGILCTPIGGAIADRVSKRNLMVIFDFCSSFVVLTLVILMNVDKASIPVIAITMMVLSAISSMYQPTVQASVPQLVQSEQLTQANGIVNSVGALSGLLGPVLGGALYGVFGVKFLIITSCSAFFVSAVMEIYIHIPFVKRPSDVSPVAMILKDTAESYHYLAKNNRVIFKVVMLAAMLNLFLSPLLMIGIPYVLRTTMNSSDMMYGIGLSAMNFAAIMGALLTASTTKKLTIASLYRPLLIAAILIVPMAIAVFPKVLQLGYLPSFLLLIVSVFFVMAISTTLSVFVISDTQKRTSPDMIGKVMGMIMTISQVAVPLGLVLYGFAFEWFHDLPQIPFLIGAVFLLLIALVSKALLKSQANPVV